MLVRDTHRAKLGKNGGDAGIDLFPAAKTVDDFLIDTYGFWSVINVKTDIQMLVPAGTFALVTGRSSSCRKLMGCDIISSIIDHGYTGDYYINVRTPTEMLGAIKAIVFDYSVRRTSLAQAIIIPYVSCSIEHVANLPLTSRGDRGYGSTDNKPV